MFNVFNIPAIVEQVTLASSDSILVSAISNNKKGDTGIYYDNWDVLRKYPYDSNNYPINKNSYTFKESKKLFIVYRNGIKLGYVNKKYKAKLEEFLSKNNMIDISKIEKKYIKTKKFFNTDFGKGLTDEYVNKVLKTRESMKLPTDVKVKSDDKKKKKKIRNAVNIKCYEGWEDFGENNLYPDSPEHIWKDKYKDKVQFDKDGLAYIIDKDNIKTYVVALGTYYGKVGDKFMVEMKDKNGKYKYINIVMGDEKDDSETDNKNMYHDIEGSENMLEFTGIELDIRSSIVESIYGESRETLLDKYDLDDICTGNVSDIGGLYNGEIIGIYKLHKSNQDLKI